MKTARLNHIYNIVLIQCIIIVVGLYTYLQELKAFTIWLLVLLLLYKVAPMLRINKLKNFEFKKVVTISYLVLSIMGLIIVFDNRHNFGVDFGYGADDSRFFTQIEGLANGDSASYISLYVIVFSIFFRIIHFFCDSVNLLDLLPINWALSAICIYFASHLVFLVTRKVIPVWLLGVCLLGNFTYVDSTVRLYRDGMLLCFLLMSFVFLINKKNVRFAMSSIIVTLLRGLNGMTLYLFLMCKILSDRFKKVHTFYLSVVFFSTIIIILSLPISNILVNYMTDASRIFLYEKVFANYDFYERLKMRNEALSSVYKEGSVTSNLHSSGGMVGSIGKVLITPFYPMSIPSLWMDSDYHGVYGSVSYVRNGFFLFNAVRWLMVVCWIFVIPHLVIGIWVAMKGNRLLNSFVLYYFIMVVIVALFSGQSRHTCGFSVLNPLLAAIGYYEVKSNPKIRFWRNGLAIVVIVGISAFNITRIASAQ